MNTALATTNLFDASDKQYLSFLSHAKNKISTTRSRIVRTASREQFNLYWWLGEQIVAAQEKFGWGKSVVEQLSKDLKDNFGSTYGFSPQNLWYMRQTYLEYKDSPNLQQLVGEIPWSLNIVILSKINKLTQREYYLTCTVEQRWTRNTLVQQIKSRAYERHLLNHKHNNFVQTLSKESAEKAEDAMKDIYMLDTLGITEPVLEAEIESQMVNKIKNVMLELGFGFSFMGNQYRIHANGNDYFIDLLFYNRRLQSLVAFEIKKGKFIPEHAGKMNFYLNLLDDFVREKHENPSIGIILCAERDKFEVEYALRGMNKPLGVSEFQLSKNLPEELKDKLPDPKELEKEIKRKLAMDCEDKLE